MERVWEDGGGYGDLCAIDPAEVEEGSAYDG